MMKNENKIMNPNASSLSSKIYNTPFVKIIITNKKRMDKKIDNWSRKGKLRRKLFLNRELYFLMTPYLILFAIFTVLPVILSVVLSFTNFDMFQLPDFVGWNNYRRLFVADAEFIIAIKNTM